MQELRIIRKRYMKEKFIKIRIGKTHKDYYALICYSDKEGLLCGVYSSVAEAKLANREIKDCGLPHKIIKCDVIIKKKNARQAS